MAFELRADHPLACRRLFTETSDEAIAVLMWSYERRQQLEQQAAKRAECSKQANEQKLPLKDRGSFIKRCVGS